MLTITFSNWESCRTLFLEVFTAMIQNKYVQTARSLKTAFNEFMYRKMSLSV